MYNDPKMICAFEATNPYTAPLIPTPKIPVHQEYTGYTTFTLFPKSKLKFVL